jgi:hypothetical protein
VTGFYAKQDRCQSCRAAQQVRGRTGPASVRGPRQPVHCDRDSRPQVDGCICALRGANLLASANLFAGNCGGSSEPTGSTIIKTADQTPEPRMLTLRRGGLCVSLNGD